MRFILTFALLTVLLHGTIGRNHVVYWDQKFIPELTNGGLEITLEVDDMMHVLCPYEDLGPYEDVTYDRERVMLELFNVSESEYERCDIRRGVRLQTCDDPWNEKKLSTKFQEQSPYPLGFTFRPGASYYYISKPISEMNRGCSKNTMKMKVNVRRKGTVFTPEEHQKTKTYHRKKKDNKFPSGSSEVVEPAFRKPPATIEKPNRHHHHQRKPAPTTAAPKVTIRKVTAKTKPRVRASPVQSGHENAAPRTVTSLFAVLLSSAATILACILLTDLELTLHSKQ